MVTEGLVTCYMRKVIDQLELIQSSDTTISIQYTRKGRLEKRE